VFERTLADQLKRIFGVDKVTFDVPGESQEQEGLFVAVDNARFRIKDARQVARVTGTVRIFASLDKMPYGYFARRLAQASAADTAGLFFFDFEENKGTFRNITERSAGFLYLFDSQYDPAIGTLNQVNLSYAGD
jgi:hypothetical protein